MGYYSKHHFYDGQQVVWEKYEDWDDEQLYVYGIGIDEPLMFKRGATQRYYHFNQLRSVTSLTDETGAKVIKHARYVVFQMAEVAVPRALFATILEKIQQLEPLR